MEIKGFFSEDIIKTKKKEKILITEQKTNFLTGKTACEKCKLFKQNRIHNPKLKPYGKFEKKILIIGEAPGTTDDQNRKPFHPESQTGKFLHKTFQSVGLNLYKDCKIINACDCTLFSNKVPNEENIKCCLYRTKNAIDKYKPKYILLLGDSAKKSFYSCDSQRKKFNSLLLTSIRGMCIPDKNSNAFVYHSYHPSFITKGKKDMENVFKLDLFNFSKIIKKNKKLKFINFKKNEKVLIKYSQVINFFDRLIKLKKPFTHDYETSSFRYYENIHELYLVSIHINGDKNTYVIPFDFPRKGRNSWWSKKQRKIIFNEFKKVLEHPDIPKIAQNIKHEIQCAYYLLNANVKNIYHDTMIAAHIINEGKGITGLKKQAYIKFGQYDYGINESIISAEPNKKNKFKELPFKVATEYCSIDSKITDRLIKPQLTILRKRKLVKANNLFLNGSQAFAEIERNGIKIDLPLTKKLDKLWGEQIKELKDSILSCKEAKKFERKIGRTLKYEKKLSDDDLRIYLFDILKLKPLKYGKIKPSVDIDTLEFYASKSKLVSKEIEIRELDKMKNTYLSQFLKLQVDGFIYPTFHLHIARSFRSSSSDPNFQNIPKRTDRANEIRQIIISRWEKEGILAEVDYGSMEVRIIACVTKDPVLLDYVINGGDMHGDWAEILFKVVKKDISAKAFKFLRYHAKNQWVFRLFYGSWYKSVIRDVNVFALFKEIKLDCPFSSQKQWENHVQKCEKLFWKQFKKTREWQDKYVEQYKKQGFIKDFAYGFEAQGYLTRNQIFNFPIQGPAYHCLQWTINNLWKNNFYNFVSLLCGQIHDALFWDCKKIEFNKIKRKVHYIMTEKIREDNPWIIVPLIDEWSKGPNWANMYDANWEKINYNKNP